MTRLSCPCCPRTRAQGQYLCPACWRALPDAPCRRLSIRDSRAFTRLRQLHGAIAAHTPLADIEVTR